MKFILYMTLASVLAGGTTIAEEITEFDEIRKIAYPKVREAPIYPRSELSRNQQGWVDLSYVVTTDGSVVDPIVIDSSGSRAFEREAKKAVGKFLYDPATVNGEPVQQCKTKVRITFATDGSRGGVSRKFRSQYKKTAGLIDAGELDAAEQRLDMQFETKRLTLSENAWLWTLRARLAGLNGESEAQLAALRKATAGGANWVDENLYPNLLVVKATLELQQGLYADAQKTFNALQETGHQSPHVGILADAVAKLDATLDSDRVFAVAARITVRDGCENCTANWQYKPLRRQFRLTKVKGNLRDVEIRCPWQRFTSAADSDRVWQMPDDWGSCSVVVYGEAGTEFQLLEEPTA